MISATTSGMTVMRMAFTHRAPIGATTSAAPIRPGCPNAPITTPPAMAAPRATRTRVLSFIAGAYIMRSPPLMSSDAPVM